MDTIQANPVKRACTRYHFELSGAMAGYVLVMLARGWLFEYWESHGIIGRVNLGWQISVAILPVVPLGFVFWAVVRLLKGMDELGRRIVVNSIAVAGGITAMLAASYGFVEGERFPHLSAWWSFGAFGITWIIAGIFVSRRYR